MSDRTNGQAMEPFPARLEERIETILGRYPRTGSALVPILQLIQEDAGFVSVRAQEQVAARLRIPAAFVAGVVSFYTMIRDRKIGKYHLQVCGTLSCCLRGSEPLLDHLKDRLGIREGETSRDGKYTLSTVECLGSCGTAPVVQINDEYYEDMSPEKIESVLEGLKD